MTTRNKSLEEVTFKCSMCVGESCCAVHRRIVKKVNKCKTCQTNLLEDSDGKYCPGCSDQLKAEWRVA